MALADYRRIEWVRARRADHLRAVAYAIGLSIFVSLALPRMPHVIPRFFQRTLQVGTWADIALLNLYTMTYVITTLVGAIDLLRIWVQPLEEGRISLYLSKPLHPENYLRARLTPVLANAVLLGLASQAASGLAVWHIIGPFHRTTFLWASLLIVAGILFVLCFLNWIYLYLRETYDALVAALVVWTVTLGPASLYVYRPDLFSDTARQYVFPANLLWYESAVHDHRLAALGVLLVGCLLSLGLARWKLGRTPLG